MLKITSTEKMILGCILIIFMYPLLVFNDIEKGSLVNFFIYSFSYLVFIFCFSSIFRTSVSSWSIFGVCYFLGLWLNTFQFSDLQVEKTAFDLYVMILGPFLFLLLLLCAEKIHVKPVKIRTFLNLNVFYLLLIGLYLFLTFYIHSQVGWRLDAIRSTHKIISGNEFVVPFYSGLWSTIAWILVILAPHVRKRYAFIAVALICVFSGILHVKRGDIIRILLFLIIYFLSSTYLTLKYERSKKYILGFLIITSIFLFVSFGQWRLSQSGNEAQIIIDITGVRINSIYLAWLFAYTIVQFDVFSVSSSALSHFSYHMNELQTLLMPHSVTEHQPLLPINGFNAGTGFWPFVRDYGAFFFMEMIVFWLIISSLLLLSKKTACQGAYCFVCLLCALMVFGNYFCNRSMILAIILSNCIFLITKSTAKVKSDD